MSNTKYHVYQLDSLRGLAALSVFFSHSFGALFTINQTVSVSPLHIVWDGAAAVQLFFVLSAYVLSFPLFKSGSEFNFFHYTIKRVFRIYPAFIFSIFLFLVLQHYFFDHQNMSSFSDWIKTFWNWDLASISKKEIVNTVAMVYKPFNTDMINPVIWSLIVELKMSLLLPFVVMVIRKSGLLLDLLLILVIFFVFRTFLPFYFGILIAKYQDPIVVYIKEKSKYALALILLLAIVLYTSRFTFQFYRLDLRTDTVARLLTGFNVLLITMGSSLLIILFIAIKKYEEIFTKKPFVFLGKLSYSFYLFHFGVLLVVCAAINQQAGGLSDALIMICAFILTMLLSTGSYYLIELPFIKFGKICIRKMNAIFPFK